MELKPGYKLTEVGVIPEDWELRSFSELFNFQNGVNADKTAYGSGLPFINVLEPITYSHLYGPEIPGQVSLPEPVIISYVVLRGDVVFNRTSETQQEIGLAAIYLGEERVVFGGFVIRGRLTDNSFDLKYAGYALRAPIIRSQIIPMGQGAIRANIGQQNLSLVLAPIPALDEQVAIAEALNGITKLLEGLERLIAKKRDLKQAAMQQLLTGQTRLPGFRDTWIEKRLDEVGHFLKGSGVTKSQANSGRLPCIRYGEIYTQHHDYVKGFYSWISCDVAATATRLQTGDLLFAGSGETKEEIGKCVAFRSGVTAFAGGDIVILRLMQGDALFLSYICNTSQVASQKASKGQGDAVVHISANALADVVVTLPSLPEQTAIATILSDMDAELATLEQRLAKTRALKQGMMQELLTGRIRLVPPVPIQSEVAHA